jgi:hypothetical protein
MCTSYHYQLITQLAWTESKRGFTGTTALDSCSISKECVEDPEKNKKAMKKRKS